MLSSRQGRLLQETAPRGWRVTGGKELEAQGLGRGRGTGGKGAWPPEPLWPSEPQAARPSWAPGAGPCSRGGARRMKRPPWVARGGRQTQAPGRTDRQPLEGASRGRAPRAGKQRPGPQPGPARDTRERPGWSRERRAGKRRVLGCSRTPTGAASRPRAPRWTQGRSLSLAPETMNCHLNRRLGNAYAPPPPCHPFSEAPGRPASLGRCGWWGAGTPLLGLLP